MERRLAAILAADVVGYSRLVGADEEGTLRTLRAYRKVIDELVAAHRGRIFGTAGDSVIAEFASPVEAVRCAAEVQQELGQRNADVPEDRRMEFRIGINLGDVVVEGDDLLGDGVNVAARLQELADPGGIYVSDDIHRYVEGKIDVSFADLGKRQLKNIAEPVHVYLAEPPGTEQEKPGDTEPTNSAVARSALAVLPFANLGQDPEQDYFADGLTEDLITALSAWHTFPVISRSSVFTYKGQAVKVQQVAAELGARYVLEGSVRKDADRVRITAQLIDAKSGHHIWAQRFDRKLENIFDVQDEITQRIVAIIAPELEMAEQRRAAERHPKSLGAWDLYQRGMAPFHKLDKESIRESRELFEQAALRDPSYAQAHSALAATYNLDCSNYWAEDREGAIAKALAAARRALALDETDSSIHITLGVALMFAGKADEAAVEHERALELNPNNAFAYAQLGNSLGKMGKHDQAIPYIEKAIEISPTRDPRARIFLGLLARAHLNLRDYERAAACARNAIQRDSGNPWCHMLLASSLGHLGQTAEAAQALARAEALEPGHIAGEFREGAREYLDASVHEHILEGLRKAGWDA